MSLSVPPRRVAATPRGFSLVELVVSLAVIGILLVGMSSAVVLASRALPHATNPAGATTASARALHLLRNELRAYVTDAWPSADEMEAPQP